MDHDADYIHRSGIGLAAALKYAAIGMHIVLVDVSQDALDSATKTIKGVDGVGEVWGLKADVSKIDEVVAFREKVFEEFGEVVICHNDTEYAYVSKR